MKEGWHRLEKTVDRLIPYMLVLLLFVIIGELFFSHQIEPYHLWIEIIDIFIILVFGADLVFKYIRIRNFKKFLRKYWLDIIAIFPFFLVFRMFEEFALAGSFFKETIAPGQKILHESLGVQEGVIKVAEGVKQESKLIAGLEKEGLKIASQVEKFGQISRTEKIAKLIKPFSRAPRAMKYASADAHKKLEKEMVAIEKGAKQDVKIAEKYLQKGEKFVQKEVKASEKWLGNEIKKGEKFIVKKEKKVSRLLNAAVFYEKPSGKHYSK